MLKHAKDIQPQPTSHGVGLKRVLVGGEETATAVTQVALTTLRAGETVDGHCHDSMEEMFFFLKGKAVVTVDGEELHCVDGDFVRILRRQFHTLRAVTDVEVLTFGVGC